jgi:hypothetical protein
MYLLFFCNGMSQREENIGKKTMKNGLVIEWISEYNRKGIWEKEGRR